MPKFISIPTEIEAIRYHYDDATFEHNQHELFEFTKSSFDDYDYFIEFDESCESGEVYDKEHDTWIPFKNGDWIIKGTEGEFYPCVNEVFIKKYRSIPEEKVMKVTYPDGAPVTGKRDEDGFMRADKRNSRG